MKVITKCVIDMKTSEIIEEESYEYEGPLALCSGSGGGGSGAGEVNYPDYMKLVHDDWLEGVGGNPGTTVDKDVTEAMNEALDNSPWVGANEYDPSIAISTYEATIQQFAGVLAGINIGDAMSTFYTLAVEGIGTYDPLEIDGIEIDDIDVATLPDIDTADAVVVDDLVVADAVGVTDAEIILDVTALSNQLDDEINAKILPQFRRGMQDVNAVVSSAFPIGEAIIRAFNARDVARHDSVLRVNAAMKNADVDMANMGKDVQVGIGNLNKDLDVSKMNMLKDTDIDKANLLKNVEVSKLNLDKDIRIETANMNKRVQQAEINTRTLVEFRRLYLEGTKLLLHAAIQTVNWYQDYSRISVEANRIKIVAYKEYYDTVNANNEENALWNLEVFQYGANILASISGGVAGGAKRKKPSAMSSAIGGAMSGAAAGAVAGSAMYGAQYGAAAGGYGALIGAVLGAAMGLLSSQ